MTGWFRSWHGAPTDPKWLGIAKRAGVAPGFAVAIAWALMDRASQAERRGSIDGYDADGLACFFGCEPEQVEAIIVAMTAKGMLDNRRFVAWERRQPKREDDSTMRVRAFRETQCNAVKRNETHGNNTDTDTERDSSSTLVDMSAREAEWENGASPVCRVTYSETERKALAFEFDGLDVDQAIAELDRWCDRKHINDPIDRKSAIYGGLRKRYGKAHAADELLTETAKASPQLSASRLTKKRRVNGKHPRAS
jgi:hypothetical protein